MSQCELIKREDIQNGSYFEMQLALYICFRFFILYKILLPMNDQLNNLIKKYKQREDRTDSNWNNDTTVKNYLHKSNRWEFKRRKLGIKNITM